MIFFFLMGSVVVYGQEFLPFPPTAAANVDVPYSQGTPPLLISSTNSKFCSFLKAIVISST